MGIIMKIKEMSEKIKSFSLGVRVRFRKRLHPPFNTMVGTVVEIPHRGWCKVLWDGFDDPIEEYINDLIATGEQIEGTIIDRNKFVINKSSESIPV